jgi:hypothetical protein
MAQLLRASWYFSHAICREFSHWFIARSDNKRQARLNIIAHLLSSIPYKKVSRASVKLPKRKVARRKPLGDSLRIVAEADV